MTNLIAAILVAIAPVGSADDTTLTRVVSYSDLDLTHAEGVAALAHRINGAVMTVCGDFDSRDLDAMRVVQQCRTNAKAGAAPQIAQAIEHARQLASARPTAIQTANR
jgi:UrcA family protein